MKTPQELADKWANHMFLGSNPDAKRAIELAIEADRAQRKLPYDTAELQGALDNNDPVQLLEIVNDIHTYQFYIEEEE